MRQLHTVRFVLTWSAACGSGPPGPKATPTEPLELHVVAQAPRPVDAGIPDAPEPPKLVCDAGTTLMMAPAPEPTWFCGRDNGVRHGRFATLFPDGTPEIEGTYKDGKLDGAWQRHYPGGALVETGAFASGLKDGHWKQLAATGATLGEYDMKLGTGTERHWYDDGPIYSERALRLAALPTRQLQDLRARRRDRRHREVRRRQARRLARGRRQEHAAARRDVHQWRASRRAADLASSGCSVLDEAYDRHSPSSTGCRSRSWRDKKIPRLQGTYDHGKRTGTWSWFDRNQQQGARGRASPT